MVSLILSVDNCLRLSNHWFLVFGFRRIRVLDCYTDPLGWIDQPSTCVTEGPSLVKLNKCVSDLKRLFSSVIDAGRGNFFASCFSI